MTLSSISIRALLRASVVASVVVLSGCASLENAESVQRDVSQLPQVVGPKVTHNTTPLEPAFTCMADALRRVSPTRYKIGVGQVRDYTGKFSEKDGGSAITQGGSLMTMSALGKLHGAVRSFDRFDTQVTDWELSYMSKRYLGDEHTHQIDNNGQVQQVPWKPYQGGSVTETDYYIVGGITELNYSIHTNGSRLEISQIGPTGRTYVANVGVDLRLVDTRTLEVVQTVSLQKQVVGYEISASVFHFFDNTLVDMNVGEKNNEPMQLAVRTTIEQAVLELVGALGHVNADECIDYSPSHIQLALEPTLKVQPDTSSVAPTATVVPTSALETESVPVTDKPLPAAPVAPVIEQPLPTAPATARPSSLGGTLDNGQPVLRGLGPDASRRPHGNDS